ncbi:hypothetical protein TrST_g3821 [Triparma strigata]|uniref:Uncharacterized protein n=1 Tax=Triparma strigata TaxID=1606541 RepID=A0A9W7EX24_9STRA|nr:hypothetical protein TrST_g3821 [Triparma strigata]
MSSFVNSLAQSITAEVVEHALDNHHDKVFKVSKRKLTDGQNTDNIPPPSALIAVKKAIKSVDKSAPSPLQSHAVSQYEVAGYGLEDRVSVLTEQMGGCTINMKKLRNKAFSSIDGDGAAAAAVGPNSPSKKNNNKYITQRQKMAKRSMFKLNNMATLILLLTIIFHFPKCSQKVDSLSIPNSSYLRGDSKPTTKGLVMPIDVVLPKITSYIIKSSMNTTLKMFYPALLQSDLDWLERKVTSVAPVLGRDDLYFNLCLLTRLIVEEQTNSRAKNKGKYGSVYHPKDEIRGGDGDDAPKRGRPLTVGELQENFLDMKDVLVARWKIDDAVLEKIEEGSMEWNEAEVDSLVEGSVTLRCVDECEGYVYVHVPDGMGVNDKIVASVADRCDVVEGGSLADAVEYMLKDVEEVEVNSGELSGGSPISFQCISRDIDELNACVKDDRNFPSKYLFVCNNRLESEKNKGIDNPFVSSLDQRNLQKLILGEEKEYSVGLAP